MDDDLRLVLMKVRGQRSRRVESRWARAQRKAKKGRGWYSHISHLPLRERLAAVVGPDLRTYLPAHLRAYVDDARVIAGMRATPCHNRDRVGEGTYQFDLSLDSGVLNFTI